LQAMQIAVGRPMMRATARFHCHWFLLVTVLTKVRNYRVVNHDDCEPPPEHRLHRSKFFCFAELIPTVVVFIGDFSFVRLWKLRETAGTQSWHYDAEATSRRNGKSPFYSFKRTAASKFEATIFAASGCL
jgi:hypothetical protein